MAKRKRDMQLNFRVSAEELAVIEQKCLSLEPPTVKPI